MEWRIDASAPSAWSELQAATALARAGDVLRLSAGRLVALHAFVPPAGVTLAGEPGSSLVCSSHEPAIVISADGVCVTGLRVEAHTDGQTLMRIALCAGARVLNCEFDGLGLAGTGIDVDRATGVLIEGCRVRDCSDGDGPDHAGILFRSARGEVRSSSVIRARSGIRGQRSPDARHLASHLAVQSCTVVEPLLGGIVFSSSTGLAEDNECRGSRERAGIAAQRDPLSPNAASDVKLRGNRSHDNKQAGIDLLSSHALAEDNECWGSRSSGGIVARRDPKSPAVASEVTLRGNRCHDNEWPGILFVSSNGLAVDNECWGSRSRSGICAESDPNIRNAPSEVTLRGNRCHHNAMAGIAFVSSHGLAENNECWASLTRGGIAAERRSDYPDAPSDVTLRGNRCHDNEEAGIAFFSSHGLAEDNECWANKGGNEVARHASLNVKVVNHLDLPRRQPPEPRLAQHAAHPLRAWLSAGPEPEKRHRLADFLSSGCGHCLASWLGAQQRGPLPEPPPEPEKVPHLFTMSAAEPVDGSVRTARAPLVELVGIGATTPPEPGLPMLDALLARVGALEHARRSKRSAHGKPIAALREPVALVSADTPALEDWLNDDTRQKAALARRRPPRAGAQGFRLTVLDGLGHGAGQSAKHGEAGFVAASLLQGRPGWRKVLTGVRAVAQAPLGAVGISLLMLIVGLVASTWLMVPANGSSLEPALGQLLVAPTDVPAWNTLLDAVGSVWRSGVEKGAWKTNFWTLLFCVFLLAPPLTRLLPEPLNPVTELLMKLVLGPILGAFGAKDSVEALELQHRLRRVLSRWLQSPSATRHWLRREIYGEPLFSALWRRRWPLALVVARGVDAPSQAQQKELREVMALCPRRHHLLVVMQMPGLAMVPGGFLDTWFGHGQALPTQAWLIHDRTSIELSNGRDAQSDTDALQHLCDLLGWEAGNKAEQTANTLGDKSPVDLLPLLVLGSTAHAHLVLARVNKSHNVTASRAWHGWQRLLWAINRQPARIDGDWLEEQDKAAQRGNALLLIQDSSGRRRTWVGRAGWRRRLAAALQVRMKEAADNYIVSLLACAEREHRRSARRYWRARANTEAADLRSLQRSLLHLEAALSLAKEHARLGSGEKAGDWHTRLFADWRIVFSYVEGARRKLKQADRIRLAGVLLSAEEHYSNGAGERPSRAMALSDPRHAPAPGIWAEVASDFWALSNQLAACGSVAAAEVLDSLRRHDWAALPDSVHDALRGRVAELSATAWHSLKDANSEAAFTQACSSLAARPALLLGLLGRMAAAYVRRNLPKTDSVAAVLAEVAEGLLVLSDGLTAEPVIESLPDWWPLGELPVCAWAARLLREPDARRTLVDVLARADVRLTELRRAATAEGVEGLAMGTHGALNRELSRGTHAEEWVL